MPGPPGRPASEQLPASAEELRELVLTQHQQLAVLRREVADANHLLDALRAILDEDDDAEPFTNVFAVLARLFRFAEVLVLVEDAESAAELRCLVANDPELAELTWPKSALIDKVLAGRVIATVPRTERDRGWPDWAAAAGLHEDQPVLYVPLRFREQRGLMMLRRAIDAEGFDRREVNVARTLSLLASQALATRIGNRAERERRHFIALASELRQARDRLAYRANHDELTGLANRTYFEQQATAALSSAGPDHRIGIAFIDLDGFKQVNDYYGHDVGDELLVAAAERIRQYAQDETDLVARISGDEFMMLINPVRSIDFVVGLARRGLTVMREPFQIGNHQLMVSASVGLAFYPDHGSSFDELRRKADMAMYRAKRTSPGSVVTYESGVGLAVATRLDQEQALRRAVAERRFRAVVQPKVSLARRTVVGFEVLARQVDQDGVLGTSAAFIGLAAQTGLLDEITDIVLEDALAAVPDLDRAFGPGTSISINVSTRQATDPDRLAELVGRILRSGWADRFILEVTEDALLEIDTFRRDIVPLLEGTGLRVSIDDFGTGYASLSRLLVINADEIKIDRSFIMAIHQRPRSQVFLDALGTIGAELGARVVAEGVETEAELAYLVGRAAVDEVQGFFFGQPAVAADYLARRDEIIAGIDSAVAAAGIGRPPVDL